MKDVQTEGSPSIHLSVHAEEGQKVGQMEAFTISLSLHIPPISCGRVITVKN